VHPTFSTQLHPRILHEVGAGEAAPLLVRLTLSLRTVFARATVQAAASRETSAVRSIWRRSRLRNFAQHPWPGSCDSLDRNTTTCPWAAP